MTKQEREDAFRAMVERLKHHHQARHWDLAAVERLAWRIVDGQAEIPA